MTRTARLLLILLVLFATATAGARTRNVTDPEAPRSLPAEGAVSVQWTDPAGFTDLKYSGNRWRASQGNWVYQLAEHLRESAEKHLPEGERLEVTITDIDRAGRYEPWGGVRLQDVRILRDHYPPSMKLEFRQFAADGTLLAEGSRELRDTGYLMGGSNIGTHDNLYYEKRMVDEWVRDEMRRTSVASN
ncbi:DUF3016 domain-containing protein [Luteimonas viscosa]|uniref:DUF3016 domain-containing protein n=1 Tax=Luteimonas viscosa TaxID=1132694 RepID=A0A5D4XQA1_9GAMM|nr:DUF3016 domain-containing protein [Luteimonas viscosa]TYT26135.1 DUF3016 domain-containing protein [Luteimonas viscosa]